MRKRQHPEAKHTQLGPTTMTTTDEKETILNVSARSDTTTMTVDDDDDDSCVECETQRSLGLGSQFARSTERRILLFLA